MDKLTIVVVVSIASKKIKSYQHQSHDGNLPATRKNPHVINAGSKHDIQRSY
jgi:hypothetical protein